MTEIKIKISDEKARLLKYYLCRLYNKHETTSLNRLCLLAIWKEACSQAKIDVVEFLNKKRYYEL